MAEILIILMAILIPIVGMIIMALVVFAVGKLFGIVPRGRFSPPLPKEVERRQSHATH